jgi:hypothetical protein
MSAGGVILDTVNTVLSTLDTMDPVTRNYKQFHHPLALSYSGGGFRLRFRSVNAKPGRFRVDNVYVAYKGEPTGDFSVEVDDAEGSVTFQVKNIRGIDPARVKSLRVSGAGAEFAISTYPVPPLTVFVQDTAQYKVDTIYFATVGIYDVLNQKVGQIGPRNFQIKRVNQIVVNPGFEGGSAWWDSQGSVNFLREDGEHGYLYSAFLGSRWVSLGGRGISQKSSIRQWVFIPDNAVSARLTFRLHIGTSEQGAGDSLRVRILDTGYQLLNSLPPITSAEVTKTPENFHGYKKFNGYDLLAYKGQKIYIEFEAEENSSLPTTFWLDNIGVTYTTAP